MNSTLLTKIQQILSSTKAAGSPFISRTIAELKIKVPDYVGKTFKDGEQPSQDHMILSLLSQVVNSVNKKLEESGKDPIKDIEIREKYLVEEIEVHEQRLIQRQIDVQKEIEVEEKEQKKHITTDDMHMGFETKTVSFNLSMIITYTNILYNLSDDGSSSSNTTTCSTKIETQESCSGDFYRNY